MEPAIVGNLGTLVDSSEKGSESPFENLMQSILKEEAFAKHLKMKTDLINHPQNGWLCSLVQVMIEAITVINFEAESFDLVLVKAL